MKIRNIKPGTMVQSKATQRVGVISQVLTDPFHFHVDYGDAAPHECSDQPEQWRRVRPEIPEPVIPQQPTSQRAMYDQGYWWRDKEENWVRIADMDPQYRVNTAAYLMRTCAARIAYLISEDFSYVVKDVHLPDEIADAMLDDQDRALNDPVGWILETPLVRALLSGIVVSLGGGVARLGVRR